MASKITGLEKVREKLKTLSEIKQVSIGELFTPAFMAENTSVETFEQLIERSGHQVQSAEEFMAIPDEEWEVVVNSHTRFQTWGDMQQSAFDEFVKEKIR